jgi:L-asparaginase II
MMEFKKVVEAWRGDVVESVHYGVAAIANADGEILYGWGDPTVATYPRSALKPVQAVALVETGACRAFELEARHIALACASHLGEPMHTDLVRQWLERLGLSEEALACGPDYPMNVEAAHALIRAGHDKSRVYHNCSGKHCGFLTVTRHMGWDVEGYGDPRHPAQQRYLETLSDLLGRDAGSLAFGVDHCTLPSAVMSVGDMATVMARFAAARASSLSRRESIRVIHEAARAHPRYMSGAGEPNESLIRATGGRVIMKTGAEGYLTAFVPDQGIGIALKIADGGARARMTAFLSLLREASLLDADAGAQLAALSEETIVDSRGEPVGRIRPCRP